jgi:hypothetical protein
LVPELLHVIGCRTISECKVGCVLSAPNHFMMLGCPYQSDMNHIPLALIVVYLVGPETATPTDHYKDSPITTSDAVNPP